MYQCWRDRKNRRFIARLFPIFVFVAAGCVPAVETTGPTNGESVETEVAVEVEEVPAEATEIEEFTSSVDLIFWYPGTGESTEAQVIKSKVLEFEDEYPEISVELVFIPSEYQTQLLTAAAAGIPPDIAMVWFNLLFNLQDTLLPLDSIDGDFLEDSLASATLSGSVLGLPLNRDSCSLSYDYLALFGESEYPDEAFFFMEYLTLPDNQSQTYQSLGWFPTRKSVYDMEGLGCSVNLAIRPPDFTIAEIINMAESRAPNLENVLAGASVIPSEATGVYESESIVGVAAPVWYSISLDEARSQIDSDGLIVGALFINDIPEYPSGDYAVKCWSDFCVLVDPRGNEIAYDLLISEVLELPVRIPRVSIEPGSKITCHYFLIWKFCTRVG